MGLLREGKLILSSTLDGLRQQVRRLSLRFAESPPDPAGLGTVLERNGTGRFWQVLVQDPDPGAIAALKNNPGVSDFEDVPVTLEEVYAALMARLGQRHGVFEQTTSSPWSNESRGEG